ncbi:SDR family oxidoreductase [Nitratireductor soli]|uniref:SDR family oxidoreductase n=1 Tax=Nitratireductor soli TaxID=1670619 RepID=UPI00065E0FAB|nr:SDR family oxidoreductase [Nitratireductor soli]
MDNLRNKVVVITGAGRGLGAAFALAFADAGCRLVVCGRRASDLQAISKLITERSEHSPDIVTLDLSDTISVTQAVEQIHTRHAHVDILINNGAMWLEASAEPYANAAVLGVINAAVSGTFLFTQGLNRMLERSEAPDVVTIGSVSGLPNAALQSVSVPFYAAKRAQVALADGLRQTFAGTKMRSILVNPPYLDDARPDQADWHEAGQRQKGQRATSRDVVEAVMFAVARPRHISLTIDLDADDGGMFPRHPGV